MQIQQQQIRCQLGDPATRLGRGMRGAEHAEPGHGVDEAGVQGSDKNIEIDHQHPDH
nr:hypothetical protein [Fodinicola feengrottensis]